MMSRKDYVKLAAAFAETEPPIGDGGSCDRYGYETWAEALSAVADVLAADNPRFDRMRFYYAASEGKVER